MSSAAGDGDRELLPPPAAVVEEGVAEVPLAARPEDVAPAAVAVDSAEEAVAVAGMRREVGTELDLGAQRESARPWSGPAIVESGVVVVLQPLRLVCCLKSWTCGGIEENIKPKRDIIQSLKRERWYA